MHEIEVTQKDIEQGKPLKCSKCPIARAAERDFLRRIHGLMGVSVDGNNIHVFQVSTIPGKATMLTYTMPENAKRFVGLFDAGKKVSPFKFKTRYVDFELLEQPLPVPV